MKNLTVQILTHNNEKTLEKALKSVQSLDADLWVLDHGSTDTTIEIASRYANVYKIVGGRAEARNLLLSRTTTEWQLLLEPWESIISGHQTILQFVKNDKSAAKFFVTQSDILTKEIRLWNNKTERKFDGQVFESLPADNQAELIHVVIAAETIDNTDYQLNLLQQWQQKSPTRAEPYYYAAMCHLAKGRYDEFIRNAEYFLFRSTSHTMPVVITRYYLAWTHCHIKRDARAAFQNLVVCLSLKPLMAEFWCLLGDIHYFLQHEFDKAYRFYDNSLFLGSKRKSGDDWPVQLSKYGEYPKKMMDSCKAIQESRKIIH